MGRKKINTYKCVPKLVVKTPSVFEVDSDFEDQRFVKIRIAVMHTGVNRNNSRFSLETIEDAKSTFYGIPILADVIEYKDENGETHLDYGSHDFHIEDDLFNEGEKRVIYDERIVGFIPEKNDFELVYDEETNNYYVFVTAWLYRDYSNYVCDILEDRGGVTDVSAEIICLEQSYSAKDKCLDVTKMCMSGITLLGEDVTPGMAKAHATMFSEEKIDLETQKLKIMQELTYALDNYTKAVNPAKNTTKGGNDQVFEQLLEKYGKTVEDITFDYEGKSDEELEVAFASAFADETEDIEEVNTEETTEDVSEEKTDEETVEESTKDYSDEEESTETEEETETESDDEEVSEEEKKDMSLQFTTTLGDHVANFSISLTEILYALSELVNNTYSEVDGDYYSVDVYTDDKYVIMCAWGSGRAYKQSYKERKGSYQLTGDRIPVKSIYVTEDEEKKLDEMKNNYSSISEQLDEVSSKLQKYEEEPEKIALFESDAFKIINDTDEFKELKKQENHFDLSKNEITENLYNIILQYATSGKLDFDINQKPNEDVSNVSKKVFSSKNATLGKRGRYGGMFTKKN